MAQSPAPITADGITLTDEERRQASLAVCRHAMDVDDARELLAALGLHDGRRSRQLAG